jgi:hypothetical protein
MSGVTREVVTDIRRHAKIAIQNETTTRDRVDRLEAWAQYFTHLGFWGRLRWLLFGK